MSLNITPWKMSAVGCALLLMLGACAVTGVGVGYDTVDVGYVGGYYEPYGYAYGGWGGHYNVGPPRGGGAWHARGGGHAAPSIPSRGRGPR